MTDSRYQRDKDFFTYLENKLPKTVKGRREQQFETGEIFLIKEIDRSLIRVTCVQVPV